MKRAAPRPVDDRHDAAIGAACRRAGLWVLYLLLRDTGARLGSVVGLCRGDLVWQGDRVLVRLPTVKGGGSALLPVSTDRLRRELGRFRGSGVVASDPLVRRLRGPVSYTVNGARRAWRRALASAGVEYVNPHRMRATFASELAARGVNSHELLAVMGWATLETAACYVRPAEVGAVLGRLRFGR